MSLKFARRNGLKRLKLNANPFIFKYDLYVYKRREFAVNAASYYD